ncbi:bifunctional 4-hydroxy-2-oxoglutarate aldolase/2-dehydro-3-deoxy-phosphogluconate aldolase [Nodosilinea sp. LEGE 06152]|uniref:bifunctional 4-hydroxy-2-oxoglutarate aldolase/2-dehydro-3-deoxy-phosphogluconate aldolase n=1 Tax=Nodosilinea sp. LEGE 06152 TaxID=2777966 RepID=UPI0018817787|nr:bifunctional 4-hydroxy-2-oxoglutarate aldolase/2-dehydro-3-deoxy-phosphogluconate aldolase [Nodosilinea sp. LEGE 06152]MBE9160025.1 bifunctional 4-hydroxy-2-oxoglutarate aldolase/2-dehydro-3-deoxy-phosphogluconate aldolase [Nodosilinea sp. LEGE 06152]
MERDSFLAQLRQHRAIAVIRADDVNLGLHLAQAAAAGGIRLIEITWNSVQPQQLVSILRQQLTHCTVGIGTALSVADLRQAAAAGAQFCFCPHTDANLIETAHALQMPIVPGALTPNEIVAAWQAGATAVKVFPVNAVGGASYIRSLQGPLAHIPLVPTGGITVENATDMVRAGAIAVGLSTGLFPQAMVVDRNWAAIEALAARLVRQLPTTQALALDAIAVPS